MISSHLRSLCGVIQGTPEYAYLGVIDRRESQRIWSMGEDFGREAWLVFIYPTEGIYRIPAK